VGAAGSAGVPPALRWAKAEAVIGRIAKEVAEVGLSINRQNNSEFFVPRPPEAICGTDTRNNFSALLSNSLSGRNRETSPENSEFIRGEQRICRVGTGIEGIHCSSVRRPNRRGPDERPPFAIRTAVPASRPSKYRACDSLRAWQTALCPSGPPKALR
jgi:hypothetical protein